MKEPAATPATPSQRAILDLQKLYERTRTLENFPTLTDAVVAHATGAGPITCHNWRHGHQEPRGANLRNLEEFLRKARNTSWLRSFIQEAKAPRR